MEFSEPQHRLFQDFLNKMCIKYILLLIEKVYVQEYFLAERSPQRYTAHTRKIWFLFVSRYKKIATVHMVSCYNREQVLPLREHYAYRASASSVWTYARGL